jgi:hypothetical protein
MNIDKVRKTVKILLMSFNVFCIGGITYNVFKGDFSNPISLQSLAIFLWLMYLTNDILRKINN